MGKVVEKVVAELLAGEADRRGLLSDGQNGRRQRRSAIDAAAIMVDRAHMVRRNGQISGVLLMDSKAAFPSVGRGRLIHTMRDKWMNGDIRRWRASFLTDRTVKIVIKGNVVKQQTVEPCIPQGLPVSLILFAIKMIWFINWVEKMVAGAEGLSFVHDVRWVATGNNINQDVGRLEACARVSIDWVERRELEFNTTKTKRALVIGRWGQKRHLRPKLTMKIWVRNGFVRFNREVTRWLGVRIDAHPTFKEHHNQCMKKSRAAEARLRSLIGTHGVEPTRARVVQIVCVQAIGLYGSKRWWDPKDGRRWDDLQLLLNQQGKWTLRALLTTPRVTLRKFSGLTPAVVALDARQQRFVSRHTSSCKGSKAKELSDYPTPGAPEGRMAVIEHARSIGVETMCWPDPGEKPVVRTTMMEDDAVAKRASERWAKERKAGWNLARGHGGWMDHERTMKE